MKSHSDPERKEIVHIADPSKPSWPCNEGKPCPACEAARETTNFLDDLCDFLGDSEGMTTEEVRAELEEEGVDVDGAIRKMETFRQKILDKIRGDK